MFDMRIKECSYITQKISTCDLCKGEADYYVRAWSPLFPFFGRRTELFICKEHLLKWREGELTL